MKIKNYKLLLILLLFNVFSCTDSPEATKPNEQEIVTVRVAKVSAEGNKSYLSVSGTISSKNSAKLSTRVMGHVEQVKVNIGDKVTKGQLLVAINSADLKAKKAQFNASITEAKAGLEIAEKDYNRYKRLFDQNSASQKEVDDMTAQYTMAKARYDATLEMRNEVDAQFTYTNVIAPYDGVITARFIDAGDLANPGMPLLVIETPNEFEVIARVPESSISKVKTGLDTNIIIPSIHENIPGKVTGVSTSSASTGGQYLVKINPAESKQQIRSGMFVTVDFPSIKSAISKADNAVLIPESIIIRKGGLTGIYTVSQQNTAILRWLRLGKSTGDQVEVLSGLKTDETYIVSADGKLFNGVKLKIQ